MKAPSLSFTSLLVLMFLAACDSPGPDDGAEAPRTEAEASGSKAAIPKPAYVIFTREKTVDPAELEIYWTKVAASLEGHPMKVLSGYGPFEVLEGEDTEGVVIAEFPSMAAAKAWYESPAYRAAREHRFKGAVYRGILVEATGP